MSTPSKALLFETSSDSLLLANTTLSLPILLDSTDNEAVHIAARTFAQDITRVTGTKPEVYVDSLPDALKDGGAIVVCTMGGEMGKRYGGSDTLEGQWESYEISVKDKDLVICGSDKRGTIYALYTLSSLIGISPFHYFADVPPTPHTHISFLRTHTISHGPPTVKYRGFFLNDEHPVLHNWAREAFGKGADGPFQVEMYEKFFELLLRLKGNYMWPAMWDSMFGVDGLPSIPSTPIPGPNLLLASRMGIITGTSHHEPMARNQKEFTRSGRGEWNFETNPEFLSEFWKYGAERAKEAAGDEGTSFTVGLRGDGDLPLEGGNAARIEKVTKHQQDILRDVFGTKDISKVPQMWAMYKEVMGYFADGLNVPPEVTPLLGDDNWGNLMAVMPEGRDHPAGGGIYYHADYVGDPRDYKWINTVSLAKMWQQLDIARAFKTTEIWILNVGDLKFLELPLEYFMTLAYDFDAQPRGSLGTFLEKWSEKFGLDQEGRKEVGDLMAKYSMYASRRKAELVDDHTFSLLAYEEAETVTGQWESLETRAEAVFAIVASPYRSAFEELVRTPIRLQANLNRMYLSVAKSNLYATQGRTAANFFAEDALAKFENDAELTDEFHALEGGKWNYMLSQTHIGYQYWQAPVRNSLPPTSRISSRQMSLTNRGRLHTRFTVENCAGAWPGDNKHNCPLGYGAPDPTLLTLDKWSDKRGRWVDVGAGGFEDVRFGVEKDQEWLIVTPDKGTIKGDGSADIRVRFTVDWETFPKGIGHAVAHATFTSSDGARMVVSVPVDDFPLPPKDFHGAIQGDRYIAWEAEHFQSSSIGNSEGTEYTWEVVPDYGRTLSGMTVYPLTSKILPTSSQPSLSYDFWVTNPPTDNTVEIILHLGPSLNFFLGQKLAFGIQLDLGEVEVIEPVPDAPLGTLPADWEDVVAAEIRIVKRRVELLPVGGVGDAVGKHTLRVWGMGAGVILERVLIDLGGIAGRAESYLGPPESVIV